MRTVTLTDKALDALGVAPTTRVPLLDLPWRPDTKDLRMTTPTTESTDHGDETYVEIVEPTYRSECRRDDCGWKGPIREDYSKAAADGLEHAESADG